MRRKNTKIRVLFVTNSLNFGGLENLIITMCKSIDRSIFEPMVACLKRKGALADILEKDGFEVIELRNNVTGSGKYTTFFQLKKVIKERSIDVIHTHNTGPLIDAFFARLLSFSFPRIVHTDHTREKWPDKRRYMFLEYFASYFVNHFIAVSEEAKEKIVQYEHINASKIKVLDNGIKVDDFVSSSNYKQAKRVELGIQQYSNVIGLSVVLRKQKGITYLLKALPEIINKIPDTVCVIGGDGPEKENLLEETRILGVEKNVIFIGPRKDIAEVLSIYDLYILPSEWEGLPLSLLEAMASKRCIIATSVGAIPKVLDNGRCGLLIPPKDPTAISKSVIALLNSNEKRKEYSDNAFKYVNDNFNLKNMIKKYENYYVD